MSDLERFSITIPKELAVAFDKRNKRKGYGNRSEAVRDLVRDALVQEEWAEPKAQVAATVTLVYDHHTRTLTDRITEAQHDHGELIVSALHVHLDHHNCLEIIVLRGPAKNVKSLADKLASIRGVKHAQLTLATEGKSIV
nr:nickel-responsive transcriptional regulator NikR [Candidatus Sigynarchaeota archaeon]